jgi:cytochrome b involved in lipid metabolism
MTLTGEEIAKHNSRESCWVIVHGKAYDVTEFLPGEEISHPAEKIAWLTWLQNTLVDQRLFSSML